MLISLICRVLHIAATCTSLGGLAYARLVLLPNLNLISEPERGIFLKRMIRTYGYIKWSGVAIVAATGLIQWFQIYPTVSSKDQYVSCFVLKMVGAVGLFSITGLLALPLESLRGMQRHRKFWSGL